MERRITTVSAGAVDLHAEVFEGGGRPIVLVMGLGAQMLLWPTSFCEALAERGYRVIRFDNRDAGLSTRLRHLGTPSLPRNLVRSKAGLRIDAPYTLTDMARDTLAILDHLGHRKATIVGASMGGMIAQRMALLAPERVRGLVSIMSSASADFYPRPAALAALVKRPRPGRDAYVEHTVELMRVIGTQTLPRHEDELRAIAAACFDRGPAPDGFLRQFAAILADGDRGPLLGSLQMPRIVVHGDQDPLVPLSRGQRAAQAMRAPLHIVRGMGHDLPHARWPEIFDSITEIADA